MMNTKEFMYNNFAVCGCLPATGNVVKFYPDGLGELWGLLFFHDAVSVGSMQDAVVP